MCASYGYAGWWSIYLIIYLSIDLSIYLSIYLSVYLSIYEFMAHNMLNRCICSGKITVKIPGSNKTQLHPFGWKHMDPAQGCLGKWKGSRKGVTLQEAIQNPASLFTTTHCKSKSWRQREENHVVVGNSCLPAQQSITCHDHDLFRQPGEIFAICHTATRNAWPCDGVCVCVNEVWENQYHTFTPVFSNSHSTDFACFSMCMKTETTPHSQPPPQSLAPSQYQWFPTPHPSPGTTHLAASEASMAARKGVRPLAVSRRSTTWSLETTAKHCAQTVQASMPGWDEKGWVGRQRKSRWWSLYAVYNYFGWAIYLPAASSWHGPLSCWMDWRRWQRPYKRCNRTKGDQALKQNKLLTAGLHRFTLSSFNQLTARWSQKALVVFGGSNENSAITKAKHSALNRHIVHSAAT